MNRAKWFFCIMLFLILSLGVLYAQKPAGPNRPANVPSDYVITPFGYFHPSCVRMVKQGETVLADNRIRFTDGTEETIPAFCSFPHYTDQGELVVERSANAGPPEIGHSWIEAGQVSASTPYNGVAATWTVPQTPTTNDGQTLYFFPGLMHTPLDPDLIIQPVLGWNDGQSGVGPWNIASWNCCPSGMAWYSTPVTVNSGDQISGTVLSECGNVPIQACPKWNITTTDVTTRGSTTLSSDFPNLITFEWAVSGALEVYSIAQCSDYPPDGGITFSNAVLYDNYFRRVPNPGWSPEYWVTQGQTDPWCNYTATTTETTVTLTY
jgi:hypothetical protein